MTRDENAPGGWTLGDDGHYYCPHGAADDVHCCNCHSGFLFDVDWCVCVARQQERDDVEDADVP